MHSQLLKMVQSLTLTEVYINSIEATSKSCLHELFIAVFFTFC